MALPICISSQDYMSCRFNYISNLMRYCLSDFGFCDKPSNNVRDNVTVTLSLYLNKQQKKLMLTTLAQRLMSVGCKGLQKVNGGDVIGPIYEYL